MPSVTLKNIPPHLHEQLRLRARRHRRSLSQEAVACLEQVVAAERVDVEALLARARELRANVRRVTQTSLNAWVSQGRP